MRNLNYLLYELSVQSPEFMTEFLPGYHTYQFKKPPLSFREDFSGSAQIACEWVKKNKKHTAHAIDLDPSVLKYAKDMNVSELSTEEQKRIKLVRQNVLKVTQTKFDMIGAYNFSFFIFHERHELLKYFKSVYESLNQKGSFYLETMGGEGFLKPSIEKRKIRIPNKIQKKHSLHFNHFQQLWEQHHYDPISEVCDYSIHFKLPDGTIINDAFTYHWRIWGIRTLRELLIEAGFQKTAVLWPALDGSNEFLPTEVAENMKSWVAYVVGIKN